MRLKLSLCVLVCLPAAAAASNSFVTQGALVAQRGRAVVKVPLKHTDVQIKVTGHLAHATVTQTFKNPYPDKIEAVYVFPLPVSAAVRDYALRVNGDRLIRGVLLRRGAARARYRRAKAAGKIAALLTQERPNVFTQRVANLEPGKELSVQLSYVSPLPYDSGTHELVFPMVVGPRFVPRKKGRRARDVSRLSPPMLPPTLRSGHDISLRVDLQTGLALSGLHSPSHLIRVAHRGAGTARVQIDAADSIPNKDFVMRYTVAGKRPRAAALTHRPAPGKPGYVMLTVQPPEQRFPANVAPREMIFVLDTSSSMTGAPLAKAKTLVGHSLKNLGPRDTFQIVRFDDSTSNLGPKMIANRPRNIKLALAWLDRLRASGGTHVTRGVEAALALPHDPARLRLVVFLTDGYVGNEAQILALVKRRMGAARLFSFGVGTAVNRYLLEEMAALGRGAVQVVRPDEKTAVAVDRFFARISSPVLTDLSVQLSGGLRLEARAPARLPDLFVGQPLVLRARLRGSGAGSAVVLGRAGNGKAVRMEVPLRFSRGRHGDPALALTWARARITELTRQQLVDQDPRLRERITKLALAHRLLTRYTAFVAVDQRSATGKGAGTTVHVPVNGPQGVMGRGKLGLLSSPVYRRHAVFGIPGVVFGRGHGRAYAYGAAVGYSPLGTMTVSSGGGGGYSARASYRVAAPRVHAVVMGRTHIRGGLDRRIIRRHVRLRINQLRFCYEKQLGPAPGLEGKVVITFTVDLLGKVIAAQVSRSTLGSPAAEACMVRAVKRWTFPATPGHDGIVQVSYPFVFVAAKRTGRR